MSNIIDFNKGQPDIRPQVITIGYDKNGEYSTLSATGYLCAVYGCIGVSKEAPTNDPEMLMSELPTIMVQHSLVIDIQVNDAPATLN